MKIKGNGNIFINSNNSTNNTIKKGKSKKSRFSKTIILLASVATILIAIITFVDKFKEHKNRSLHEKDDVIIETRNIKPSENKI